MTVQREDTSVHRLVAELFAEIQGAQGHAFCSDGETFKSVPEFFARIRGRLEWNKEATRIMIAFLRKHDQYGAKSRRVRTSDQAEGL